MKLAFITLSNEGARLMNRLKEAFPGADCFIHEGVQPGSAGERFGKITELTEKIFPLYEGILFIAPCGIVVRAIAPHIKDKTTDPAVVQIDAGGRWAVSLLSGHEGGANRLATDLANAIGAEPVVSTAAEALKNIIVGVGCKRGKGAREIIGAIRNALAEANAPLEKVRYIASADVKRDEAGLMEAAGELRVPLRFITSDEIRNSSREFGRSEFVEEKVNLPAVAEPAALLAGRRTTLLLPRRIYDGITVALARENSLSLE